VTPILRLELPIRTVSTLNAREHWAAKHRRAQAQRQAIRLALCGLGVPHPPVVVRLTRLATKSLDGDNLQGAMKNVRDEIAAWLRVDDADPRVSWQYDQELRTGEGMLRVFSRSGHMKRAADMRVRVEVVQCS
jgi:hypothetical protein